MNRPAATRSRARTLRFALAILILCAACSPRALDDTPPAATSSGSTTTPRPSGTTTPAASPRDGGGRPSPPGGDEAPSARPAPGTRAPAPAYEDHGPVGRGATLLLRASPARRLVVEIDYVAGKRPSDAALDHLASVIRREARKPGGVTMLVDDEIPSEADVYSLERIRTMERRHRDVTSAGDRASIWIVYLDGEMQDASGALGVAYESTGAAIFADRVRSAATAVVRPGSIERAVLVHEVGHLFGLVNLAIRSPYDHEDPDHRGHSRYEDSVMFWAVDDVSIASLISGGPPSDFARYDRADLAIIRGE